MEKTISRVNNRERFTARDRPLTGERVTIDLYRRRVSPVDERRIQNTAPTVPLLIVVNDVRRFPRETTSERSDSSS